MYQTFKRSLVAASTLLTLGAVALPAAARTVPASIGVASYPSGVPCFEESFGSRKGLCDGELPLAMALPIENFGTHTATVGVQAQSASQTVSCAAITADLMFTSYSGTPRVYPSVFGTPQLLTVSRVVPDTGTFEVVCWVGKGSKVHGISYNP